MKDCILYFVKYPEVGKVKTRLAKDSLPELATELYSTFAKENLEELSAGCDADIIVCHTPEKMRIETRDWLGSDFRYIAQKGSALSRRMENGFREAFFMGYDRVVLVRSDIPGLSPEIVNAGIAALAPGITVLGPVGDGGYYLIGFLRGELLPNVLHDMEWDTDSVLQITVERLENSGRECVMLDNLEDIDTYEDLATVAALGTSGPLGPKALSIAREITGT